MKDSVHPAVHRSVHVSSEGKFARSTEVGFHARVDFGQGQNNGVGWSGPTFRHLLVAKKPQGSLQPTRSPRSASRGQGK